VFFTLAPGPDNTKVYCISSIGCNKQYNKRQGRERLNCKGRFRAVSTVTTQARQGTRSVGEGLREEGLKDINDYQL
jgi:hypothetical protein